MLGRLLLWTFLVLWLVHSAHLKNNGYRPAPASGEPNGPGPQPNGNGGGVGRILTPFGGYRNKGATKGNSYGAAAAVPSGYGAKTNGYGAVAGLPNGNGQKSNGYGAGVPNGKGQGAKPYGASATASNGHVSPNPNAGMKGPIKGYSHPPFGAGAALGMGTQRRIGVPQLSANRRGVYGVNGYGAQPRNGYRPNGAYARGGLGQGFSTGYSNGAGQKGPKPGYTSPAAVPNGQGARPNDYGARADVPNGRVAKPSDHGGLPNGYRPRHNGYGYPSGGAKAPKLGYGTGTGVTNGQGTKPKSYGIGPTHLQNSKGIGARAPNGEAKATNGGYDMPNEFGLPNGYGLPNGQFTKGVFAPNRKGPKGDVRSPEAPSIAPVPDTVPIGPELIKGVAPAPNVPQGKAYPKLAPLQQGNTYSKPAPEPGQFPQGQLYPQPEPVLIPQVKLFPKPEPAQEQAQEPVPVSNRKTYSKPAPEPAQFPQGQMYPQPEPVLIPRGKLYPKPELAKQPAPVPQGKTYPKPAPVLQGKTYPKPSQVPAPITPQGKPCPQKVIEPAQVPQGKAYPKPASELAPVVSQWKPYPKPAPKPVTPALQQGKTPNVPNKGGAEGLVPNGQAPNLPLDQLGYVTGSEVPEKKNGGPSISPGDRDIVRERNGLTVTKYVAAFLPETMAAKNTGPIVTEDTLTKASPVLPSDEVSLGSKPAFVPEESAAVSEVLESDIGNPPDYGPGAGIPRGQGVKPNGYGAGAGLSGGAAAKGYGGNPNGYGAGATAQNRHGAKPNGYGAGAGVSKGSGVPNGFSAKPNGYGAGANGGGAKAPKPGYGAGAGVYNPVAVGYGNGYGAGKSKQHEGYGNGNGQGVYPGAAYGNGYGTPTNGNGYGTPANGNGYGTPANGNGYGTPANGNGYGTPANGNGYGTPANGNGYGTPVNGNGYGTPANGGSGPYNGAPIIPAGLDGTIQFQPQPAGLGLSGSYGGQPLSTGQEAKSYTKYGIGGLHFGGQPLGLETDVASKYGKSGSPYGSDNSKSAGQYGYGAPYAGQPLGQMEDPGKSAGKYGYGEMPTNPQPIGLGPHAGKSTAKYGLSPDAGKSLGKYGGGAPEPFGLGGEKQKSADKYSNLGQYEPHLLEPGMVGRSTGQYENVLPYEPLSLNPVTAGKPYGSENGQLPPAQTVGREGEGKSSGKYGRGYLNGQVQAEVVSFPTATTSLPSISHAPVPLFVPVVSSFPSEAPSAADSEVPAEPAGTAALSVVQTQAPPLGSDATLPQTSHQIHIQQHLKLHIHPQGKSWRGGDKEKKYELTGFLGNGRHQG
ncbi:calymmin isoform X3 [Esox lucius]|uniref:calymmin isoform X3 n=1 Tax=Esox lucius TaxID=8010 RepID=UPI0014774504|nr:calymmin isoform X3 [Esox lucius]